MTDKITRDAFSYGPSGEHKENCGNCAFYNADDDKDCDLYETMNAKLPKLFDLDKEVTPDMWCGAHRAESKESHERIGKLLGPTNKDRD